MPGGATFISKEQDPMDVTEWCNISLLMKLHAWTKMSTRKVSEILGMQALKTA